MGNLIPSNPNNDYNLNKFNPTKISGCRLWFDATDTSKMYTTDYMGTVDLNDNFLPTDLNGCSTWFDSSDQSTIYTTSAGPVEAVSSPTDINGCALWLDASDASTLYINSYGPSEPISSPLDISDCVGWWDASDSNSIIQESGLISQWLDKSGANRNASASGSNRPSYTGVQNGNNVVSFDGIDDEMSFSGVSRTDETWIVVVSQTTNQDGTRNILTDSNGYGIRTAFGGGNSRLIDFSFGNFTEGSGRLRPSYGTNVPLGLTVLSAVRSASSGFTVHIDGTQAPSAVNGSTSGTFSGSVAISFIGGAAFHGRICEILCWSRPLTDIERRQAETYLASKWGISGVHPQSSLGSSIGYWGDKSGNNRHAIQETGSARPIRSGSQNGLNVITFDGINDTLTSPLQDSDTQTIFWIVKTINSPDYSSILNYNGSSGNRAIQISAGGVWKWYGPNLISSQSTSSYAVMSLVISSASSVALYQSGWQVGTADPTNQLGGSPNNLTIGSTGTYTFKGEVAEIIIYNRALSISERGRVEKYLDSKWGLGGIHLQTNLAGPIGYWGDKSGNNRHARQERGDYRPTYSGTINNLPAITFDGSNDYFDLGNIGSAFPNFGEVFIVFEPDNATTYELYQTVNNYPIFRYADNSSAFGAFVSTRATPGNIAGPTYGVHITSMRANASSMTVRLDGNVWHTQSGLGYNGGWWHTIGYSYQGTGGVGGIVMKGKIVEVITYNVDIGAQNRAKVEQYLARKWGVSQNLHDKSDDGKKVGYWISKGPNTAAVKQNNVTKRPILGSINGKNAVEFSSTQNYLVNNGVNFQTSNNFSIFWVGRILNSSGFTAFRLGGMNYAAIIARFTSALEYGGSVGVNLNKPTSISSAFVESIIKSSGTIHANTSAFRNNITVLGSSYGTNSEVSLNSGPLVMGSYWGDTQSVDNTTNLVIGEFIFYNRSLSTAERNLVEKYLYEKWNIDKLNQSISKPTEISGCTLWLDADDRKTLFQDSRAINPITSDDQFVAYWADKATGQDVIQTGSTSLCPKYKINIQNGKPMLYFDGGDDLLSQVDRITTGPCTIIVVCRLDSYSGDIPGIVTYGNNTGGLGGPGIVYNGSPGLVFLDGAGSGTAASSNSASSTLGLPRIMTAVYTQANTTNSYLYLNGNLEEYFSGSGVTLTSNTNRVQIGARTGGGQSTRRMIGYVGECITYNKVLSDAERSMVENYLSEKWGIGSYTPPNNIGSGFVRHKIKVSNKDAQNWVDRVFENGGTVSEKTADLVNSFCDSIDASGLRDKFYRLNLFCGNDLNACLTPLYLGPDDSTFYGFRTEFNTSSIGPPGFLGTNYTEKNGLTGSGAVYLLTGISPDSIGLSYTGHYSIYQTSFNFYNSSANSAIIGTGYTTTNRHYLEFNNKNINFSWGWVDGLINSYAGGLYVGSRDSLFSIKSYEQGIEIASESSDSYAADRRYAQSGNIAVFGATSTGNTMAFTYAGNLKGYSIGKSMSSSDIASFNVIMESFQSSLGRGLPIRSSSIFSQVTNEDAKRWIDNVYYNGGTVSSSTALAVNEFCNSIDAAGLRNKFYRLNLFCGNNLSACLVPLYKGTSAYGRIYGNTIDVNVLNTAGSNDFVYSESDGLLGNTQDISGNSFISRRYLRTGLITGSITALNNNLHSAVYTKTLTSGGYPLGSYDTASTGFSLQIGLKGYNVGAFANSLLNFLNTSTSTLYPSNKGLYVGNYSNYLLTAYEGRAEVIGQRDITSTPLIPTTVSDMGVFGEYRFNNGIALFNYLDRLQGYSIGSSLSSSDVQSYYDIMQTFQAALSRANQDPVLSSQFDFVTNLDARDWLTRVYKNNGTVSVETATAVQNFCNSIDSAGLRNKFYRLNLFCGNNLEACTVPLYRGESRTGTQRGFLYDIANNIITSDYNESGILSGIKGNGSNKYLETGLGTDFTNNSSLSFGAFITSPTETAFSTYLGVFQNNNADATVLYYRDGFTRGVDGTTFYPSAPTNSILTGHHIYSRTASNSFFHSWNGTSGATSSSSSSARGKAGFTIHAMNNNGTLANYGNGRISMYHIGLGLTTQQVSTFSSIVDAFNTEMGRSRPSSQFASVTNEDAKIWIDNVYSNGGTVSSTAANAVNTLCDSINSNNLRNKFYRMNLFCGNNLSACLVPLYRGPDITVVYGNPLSDTNNNFVSADFGESNGLIGNSSTKWLDTGLAQNFSTYRHFGVVMNKLPTTVYRMIMGAKSSSIEGNYTNDTRLQTDGTLTTASFWTGNASAQLATGISLSMAEKTFVCAVVDSDGNNKLYSDTISSNAVTTISSPDSTSIGIFAQKMGANGLGTSHTDARLSLYTIGINLSSSEVATLTSIIDTFNDSLNRGKPSNAFASVNNTEVKRWINNVYTNGGSLSANTANAVNTLANTINSIGIRSKIWRMNLLCGNNLSSALVPLYRGPSAAASSYGSFADSNNNFVSGDYNESGTYAGLKGNGSNKYLSTGLGTNIFTNSDRHLMVYESSVSTTTYATLIQGGTDFTAPTGLWFLGYPSPATAPRYGSLGDSIYASAPNYGVPGMFLGTGSSSTSELYRNGDLISTVSSATPADVDNSQIIVFAGYAPGGSVVQHIDGSLCAYSIGQKLTSSQVKQFSNALESFNLALSRGRPSSNFVSVLNEDAKLWIDGVYANGGTVSSTTASAINTFCNSINSAGLRNKFYRLNLICGNNLSAALVPVYKGPAYDGVVCGNPFDANNNFISADYSEQSGLVGNGSNKYLNPGMTVLGSTGNESISCYVLDESTTSTYYLIGSHATSNNNRTLGITYYSGEYRLEDGHTGGEFATGLTVKTIGFRSASSSGLSLRKMYLNGSVVFSSSATTVSSTGTVTPYIFCRNNGGSTFGFGNQRIASYHIGISMTDSEMASFYNIVQTFQSSLNRNI